MKTVGVKILFALVLLLCDRLGAQNENWLPLANTPGHPEYPAAHGCVTGAVSTILAGYFGTPNLTFPVDSKVTGNTHTFTSTNDLMHEVEAARIYAGFHITIL